MVCPTHSQLPVDQSLLFSFESELLRKFDDEDGEEDDIVSLPPAIFSGLPPALHSINNEIQIVPTACLKRTGTTQRRTTPPPWPITTQDLFEPLGVLVNELNNRKRACELRVEKRLTWQHKLLYQSRCYVPWQLQSYLVKTGGHRNSHDLLHHSPSFKAFLFYRRLVLDFGENWTTITPVCVGPSLLKNCPQTQRQTEQIDGRGIGVCGFLISPFTFVSYRLTRDAVCHYQQCLSQSTSTNSSSTSNPIPYWEALLGPASKESIRLPTIQSMLRSHPSVSETETDKISAVLEETFSAALLPQARIVVRPKRDRQHLTEYFAALTAAASEGCATLVSSEQSLDEPMHVFYLMGGKDMLALDWLPFVSQALKHFSVRRLRRDNDQRHACRFKIGFLLYEYPSYGFKTGHPSPENCLGGALDSLQSALSDVKSSSVVSVSVVGYSLGSAVCLSLARELAAGVVWNGCSIKLYNVTLLAPLTKVSDCAAHLLQVPAPFQLMTSSVLSWFEEPSVAWNTERDMEALIDLVVQSIEEFESFSVKIYHGDEDDMVSPTLSRRLFEGARRRVASHVRCALNHKQSAEGLLELLLERIQFVTVEGANHLSLASDVKYASIIHEQLYEERFVHLVPVAVERDSLVHTPDQ